MGRVTEHFPHIACLVCDMTSYHLDSQPERLMLRAMLYAWLSHEDNPDDV